MVGKSITQCSVRNLLFAMFAGALLGETAALCSLMWLKTGGPAVPVILVLAPVVIAAEITTFTNHQFAMLMMIGSPAWGIICGTLTNRLRSVTGIVVILILHVVCVAIVFALKG